MWKGAIFLTAETDNRMNAITFQSGIVSMVTKKIDTL